MITRRALFGFALAASLLAANGYKVATHWAIGGDGGWDYATFDPDAHRLYVSHATKAVVLDSDTGRIIGEIADAPGIHGIAIAPKAGLGFTSNGRENTITAFDLKTLAVRKKIKVGTNPDAIQYEPTANVIITFNGGSKDATVVSVEGLAVLSTLPLGSKPEFSATDGKGSVWVNLEDKNALVRLGGAPLRVLNTWPLDGCDGPSGLAIDPKNRRVFSVCGNKVMTVLDADNGKQIARLPIGDGADGVVFDSGSMNILASAGEDGVVTVIHESTPDKFAVATTIPTKKSARTIAIDSATGRAFLPAAEMAPPAAGSKRPTAKPGTFEIIVLAR